MTAILLTCILPPVESSLKYVEYMGGSESVLKKVEDDIMQGNYRWAVMVLNHVVFAEPGNQKARNLLAEVYVLLAYGAESAPWRNFYLTGAQELKYGIQPELLREFSSSSSDDLITNLPLEDFYDYIAVRIDRSKTN